MTIWNSRESAAKVKCKERALRRSDTEKGFDFWNDSDGWDARHFFFHIQFLNRVDDFPRIYFLYTRVYNTA